MTAVYRHRHPSQITYYKELLEQAGIPTFTKNMVVDAFLAGSGDTITDWLPTLHVVHEDDYARARALIQESEAATQTLAGREDWVCPDCQESRNDRKLWMRAATGTPFEVR